MKPVIFPPGRDRLATKPEPIRSETITNTIGIVRVCCCNAVTLTVASAKKMSGASATNSCAYLCARSASFSPQRRSIRIAPAQLLQCLLERREAGLTLRIVCGTAHEYADAPYAFGLLRTRR